LIKNFFANKYGYTPAQVEALDTRIIDGFLILENERNRREEAEKRKQEHLNRQKSRGL